MPCLVAADFQPLGKTEHRDAVNDAKIGLLRLGPFLACHLTDVFLIDVGGGSGMKIFAVSEHLNHVCVTREMCHHTEFYLRIVGGEEQATRLGDETLTDFLAILTPYRNVLEVGVA